LAFTVLGLSGALSHDPSAALYVDGKLVAAAEEERFNRQKHAKNQMPLQAAKFCLEKAGISPTEIDKVAFPYASISLLGPARWHYAKRYWYAPDRALDAIFNGNRRYRRNLARVKSLKQSLGITAETQAVEHHLAHASSAYHLSGFEGKTAILGIDGKGEYATTFFGYGDRGEIHKIKEFYDPDSLGQVYGAFTEYLGFDMLDGEYKVMGMAPYGDPDKYDLSRLLSTVGGNLSVNTQLTNTVGLRRYKEAGRGFFFSQKLIDWLGPRRTDDEALDPYVDYAAAMQQLYEENALNLIEHYLGDILRETGQLCFAGGGALNVKLNQRILSLPYVDKLFVQPAASDAGTAIGAASYVSVSEGQMVEPLEHLYLGPSFTTPECQLACEKHSDKLDVTVEENITQTTAELLAAGHPVAWFQGAMEFGPRALGGRSILGCPSSEGIADRINEQIKYREKWRPFCPSLLEEIAEEVIQTNHPAPYMTITFDVAASWHERIPEVVHKDGTARVQTVSKKAHPRYHELLTKMTSLTGTGVLLNTSLNRRGEPIVCTPEDALDMFFGSDLQYLAMEDLLVSKR